MPRKLVLLTSLFTILCTPLYANTTPNTLWETVQSEQVKGKPEGLTGAWPEKTAIKDQSNVMFVDQSPFSSLQIMMRLEAINAITPLSGYNEVKTNFKSLVNYYLNHRLPGEPFGSIGFWPVWKLDDGKLVRAPSTSPFILKLIGGILPADIDDSSQMAIWLYKTDPENPYIAAYLKMLESIIDKNRVNQEEREYPWKEVNSGAFMTWVNDSVLKEENSVDCVVNINVLTSLAYIKQRIHLTPVLQQAEQQTTNLVFDVLAKSKFPICSYYYSRWSHFYLALGKLHEAGGGAFTKEQWQFIRSSFKEQLVKSWQNEKHQATLEWAELLLAAKMLQVNNDPALQAVLTEIKQFLQQKVNHDDYHSLIEGNDVFRGEIKADMLLLWYVKGQTAATIMEALA